MRFSSYVMWLLAVGTIFYMLGYTSPLMFMLSNQNPTSPGSPVEVGCEFTDLSCNTGLIGAIKNVILGGGFGILASMILGFSSIYIIPLIMLLTFLNFVIFPISFIFDPSQPVIVQIVGIAFFNVITILAISNYIRGNT